MRKKGKTEKREGKEEEVFDMAGKNETTIL